MNRLPTPMFQASVNIRGSQMRTSFEAAHQVRHHQRHPADVRGRVQEPAADQAGECEDFGGHEPG